VFIQMKKGLQTKKGFNHNTGDTVPRREFFGLTNQEAQGIANSVKEVGESRKQSRADLFRALELLDIEQTE